MRRAWWRPDVLLPGTFLAAILAGTGALLLPGMATEEIGLLEAFFTATSAVCVTGLSVVDTGTGFTAAGQAAIAALIQIGGLGIMTFSVLALALARRRVSLQQEMAMRASFAAGGYWGLPGLLGRVVLVTLCLEAAGFAFLYAATGDAWTSAFHAVSAFCNAGFSLYPASLQGRGLGEGVPILLLFVVGGLGFTTILELARSPLPRGARARRFTLHARLALRTTLSLWALGAILLLMAEGGGVWDAIFMSAAARTAGFDTTPVGALTRPSLFLLVVLMFVGASPGSTGGGIKTTTFAIAVLAARATLRGQTTVVTQGREIPRDLLTRMFAIVICSLTLVFLAIFLLDTFERDMGRDMLALVFEAVSAFGTVGLSTGITPGLTAASKLVLCAVMFVGRVGSLSFFLMFAREAGATRIRYPEERILVG